MDEKTTRARALLDGKAELWFSDDVKKCVELLPIPDALKQNIEKQLKAAWCEGAYTAVTEYGDELRRAGRLK